MLAQHLHEIQNPLFKVGDTVRLKEDGPGGEVYHIVGATYEYRGARDRGWWNFHLATSVDIENGYVGTDGFGPQHLDHAAEPVEATSEAKGDGPRAYTAEEVRDMLLENFRHTAKYWADLPDVDKATGTKKTILDRCDGVVFSILAALDGCGMTLPAIDLKLAPHPEDKEFLREEGSNWFEPGMEISFSLHEHYYKK
jgi:hypothetical protein